jgi:hypothetical protein
MKSSFLAITLASASLGLHLASAYTGHPSIPFVKKPPIPASTGTRQPYDLGLGKNAPVNCSKENLWSCSTDDPYKAVRYLVEHHGVIELPSPLQKNDEDQRKDKQQQTIVHSRFSDDVLFIDASNKHPIALIRKDLELNVELDVNTIWVEMLIHEQQAKFASCR